MSRKKARWGYEMSRKSAAGGERCRQVWKGPPCLQVPVCRSAAGQHGRRQPSWLQAGRRRLLRG